MAFSLSRRSPSRALGRNSGPFVLVVLFKLFVLLDFVSGAALRTIIAHQVRAESIERDNFVRISLDDGRARHATNDAGVFALRDGHSARRLDCAEPLGPIIPHAGHQYAHGSEPKLLGHGVEEHVRGWPVPVHGRSIGEHHDIAPGHAANHHVAIPWTDQNTASKEEIAGARFVNIKSAAFVEALREHFGEAFRHVLHNQNCGKKIRGDLRQNKLQCVWPASGNSDRDDAARRQRGAGFFFRQGSFFDDCRWKFAASGALGDLDLGNQLVGNFLQTASSRILGLGEKIDGAERETFQSGVATLLRMSAEENDRQGSAPHDETQGLHTVHPGHLQIERDDIRLQLFNFLQSEGAVHGRADNFDRRFAREDRGDQLAHEGGVIDDENSDALAHAIAPSGVARERRERTAGTFRMRTTVPSPRMEAPLTRSLETISPGRALITSSSSPTIWSTSRPKRRSAAPMTITKFFFFFSGDSSTAWIRSRRFKRTSVRIWSRRRSTSR